MLDEVRKAVTKRSFADCLTCFRATTGSVLLGFTNMQQIFDVVSIANILPIDSFDPETLQNDIAIVHLSRAVVLGGWLQFLRKLSLFNFRSH